ncbi:MAG: glycosyltransferase [Gammaproteobacteria bacterium]|nr:glycosyltransferase [Gammaproteobacteria bacterium]
MIKTDCGHIHIVAYHASKPVQLNHEFSGTLSQIDERSFNLSVLKFASEKVRKSDQILVVIDARCELPEFWLTRLITPLLSDYTINISSALTTRNHALSPLAEDMLFKGSLQKLDQLIYHLQQPQRWYATDQINPFCFAVNLTQLPIQLESLPDGVSNLDCCACDHLLVQPTQRSSTIKPTNLPRINNQKRLPSHPLSKLRYRLCQYLDTRQLPNHWFQLDSKPVVLHICMNWEGGVQKWVNDVCHTDRQCHHLVLQSTGEYFRHSYGEQFRLLLGGTDSIEIDRFELSLPIDSTIIEHREYRSILTEIIHRYSVQVIFVSTLIGHSMECLDTGLPTVRIFHDYFPHWPALLAQLDKEHITEADLDQAFEQSKQEPFGGIEADQLSQWRNRLETLYEKPNVRLIAPDQSVVEHLQKLSDHHVYRDITIITHGVRQFNAIDAPKPSRQFTILVPGRMGLPKGQQLIEDSLPQLTDFKIIFLGAGRDHCDYSRYSNVEVIEHYLASELPELLKHYQPHLALILSIASETFSYTLSEMFQAGIPVIATAHGALKTRIKDGKTGFLIQPQAQALIDCINQLVGNPQQLEEIRNNLLTVNQPDTEHMIQQYHALWIDAERSQNDAIIDPDTTHQIKSVASHALALSRTLNLKKEIIVELESRVKERTDWALKQQQHVNQLSTATDHFKQENQHQSQQIAELSNQFNDLNQKFCDSQHQLRETSQQLNITQNQLSTANAELELIYHSHSWKLTRPLRDYRRWMDEYVNRINFTLIRIGTYPARIKRSLGARGVIGTAIAAYSKFKHQIERPQPLQPQVELQQSYLPFTIESSESPTVSIIIPVYNQFLHTYNCLQSLSKLPTSTGFEVLVIDDCSSDETESTIKVVTGMTYHRKQHNSGFIESCNQGAALAKGEFLVFLNNDTLVHDQWLDALLTVFERFADTGLVGSKLVYPDGSLQEAGGIVFSDASGWNYGRNDQADKPEYNFVRKVSYCSGASIMIRKELFEQLGRFDERYKPAYYEDTDLAFAVRQLGLHAYYQPASVVTHFEGVTSGTDLASGVKQYQVVNQSKFLDKWNEPLKHQANPGTEIGICRLQGQPRQVLIYDACTPTPDQDSGSLRMVNLIEILQSLGYHVCFMAENLANIETYTQALQQTGVECIYHPHVKTPIDYFKSHGGYFHAVILSRYYIAEPVMPMIRQYCPNAIILFDTVDLHYLREQRLAEFENSDKLAEAAQKTRGKELSVIEQADITLVVSSFEQEFLASEAEHARVEILSNIHHVHGRRKPYRQRKDIMFVGGYQHPPNIDAITWFARDIFPLVRKELDIQLHIIGSKAPREVSDLQGDGVVFQGFVEDIEPFVDDCRIAIAPLRYGAGVKGKVNMSMSYGQPVVATSIAAEGMFTRDGHDILLADNENEFAQAIIKLYNDSKLWNKLSNNGLKNVEKWFSFNAAREALKTVLDTESD